MEYNTYRQPTAHLHWVDEDRLSTASHLITAHCHYNTYTDEPQQGRKLIEVLFHLCGKSEEVITGLRSIGWGVGWGGGGGGETAQVCSARHMLHSCETGWDDIVRNWRDTFHRLAYANSLSVTSPTSTNTLVTGDAVLEQQNLMACRIVGKLQNITLRFHSK